MTTNDQEASAEDTNQKQYSLSGYRIRNLHHLIIASAELRNFRDHQEGPYRFGDRADDLMELVEKLLFDILDHLGVPENRRIDMLRGEYHELFEEVSEEETDRLWGEY